ncbi:uncharacterized protein LOC142558271 [Dermacentor variabilis]|uniref:uncharacterized protein LOC142558271 n=1 Tax=Dermacentor variabilis TaxID=34621 RepID=UPI003F5BD912
MEAQKATTRPLFMPSQKEPTPRDAKKQRLAATEALHDRILHQHESSESQTEGLVAQLKATIEKQAKELKKVKLELKEAGELNKKLTNALLEKIEVARGKAQEKDAEVSAHARRDCAQVECMSNLSVGYRQPTEASGLPQQTAGQVTDKPASLNEVEATNVPGTVAEAPTSGSALALCATLPSAVDPGPSSPPGGLFSTVDGENNAM